MSIAKMLGLAIVGLIVIMVIRSVGLPDISAPTNMDWMMYVLPILFLIVGFALVYNKISGGWGMVILGLFVLWLGYDNVADTGRNIGQGVNELTSGLNENGPLPTTGKIVLDRTIGDPQVFALAGTYRQVDVLPGHRVCYDPYDKVGFGDDTGPTVHYVKSKTDDVIHVHMYLVLYGHDCRLSPPAPDESARPETELNRQAHASGRGGFSFTQTFFYCGTSSPKVPTAIVKMP